MNKKTKDAKAIKADAKAKKVTVADLGGNVFAAFSEAGRMVGRVKRISAQSKDGRGQPSYKKMEHDGHTTLASLGDKATVVAEPSAKMLASFQIA